MKHKICLLAVVVFFTLGELTAQTDSLFWNREMSNIATPTSRPGWINIRDEANIKPLTFFSTYKQALRLQVNDDMRLSKTEVDKIGMTHYRYQQYYKGYKVMFGEFVLHEKEGRLTTANGQLINGLNKTPVIKVTAQNALQVALQFLPAAKYAWQVPELETMFKQALHDENATYKPQAELVWISSNGTEGMQNISSYELAYVFDIYPASLDGKKIFVSATDGRIIQSLPLSARCDGTAVATNFYGSQAIATRLISGSAPPRWNLWNDCQTAFIHTRQWVTDATSNEYVSSAGNNWPGAISAATSHWATERAFNYFFSIHGRSGWNNANSGVNVFHDALFCYTNGCTPFDPNNASMSFSGGVMMVGNAGTVSTIDDYNTADIIAHEFTHAVTASSFAALIYQKESGALNESFSDIFGITCHAWLFGLNGNTWKVGFDRKNPNNVSQSLYLRNMANPNDASAGTPSPDTYLTDPLWISTTMANPGNDNWGVHTNSGVQNYMYYLLTAGGSGTNANGTHYSLIGIGMAAAREIAYRALTVGYLFSTSDYKQARTAWVHAAVDLYGQCSLQAIETGKAWDAVGLPPPVSAQTTPYCGTYGSAVFAVTNPGTYSLAPNCVMNVGPSSLVQFGANQVVMHPGFKATNGSRFRAYVSDCRYAAY